MPLSNAAPMLLTRTLLYTAMTRAKKLLIIVGNKNIIDFIKNVFTGNWKGAWENVKNIFKNNNIYNIKVI